MSVCPDAATKKKTFVRTKETATFSVRRILIVDRILATTFRMIVNPAAVKCTVQISKYAKAIKRLEIIAIEIANVLQNYVRIISVIKLANKTRKITTLILS